jgi:hypothetical protein
VAKRVETHVHPSAFAFLPAGTPRLAQAGVDEQLAELIAERCDPAGGNEFESARVDRCARIVGAGREGKEMLT